MWTVTINFTILYVSGGINVTNLPTTSPFWCEWWWDIWEGLEGTSLPSTSPFIIICEWVRYLIVLINPGPCLRCASHIVVISVTAFYCHFMYTNISSPYQTWRMVIKYFSPGNIRACPSSHNAKFYGKFWVIFIILWIKTNPL